MDLATLMRLQGAVKASLASLPTGQAAVAGKAMAEAYMACRTEVRSAVDSTLHPEFDRMLPTVTTGGRGIGLPAAAQFNEARGHLGRLDGWLDGQIEYLKFERQAQLDAEATGKASRKSEIGFKPIDTRERTSHKDPPPPRRKKGAGSG